ncbi:MAG: hypothetical protein LBV26_07955 [Bacteroidales bacterium]|jgi:hypothetical protein|nr:hypothetical protein [Bacteroidales bacterium]
MKKTFTVLILLGVFCIPSVLAGPFGIDMGMSLAQVKAVSKTEPVHVQDDVYEITPPKTNDMFETYYVRIDPEYGVYWLKAIGKDVNTNNYGHELISVFNSLAESIEKTYGNYEKIDRREVGLGNIPDFFMKALEDGARTLGALWQKEYGSTLPDEIETIAITVEALSEDLGYVALEYSFSNTAKVKAKADSVF